MRLLLERCFLMKHYPIWWLQRNAWNVWCPVYMLSANSWFHNQFYSLDKMSVDLGKIAFYRIHQASRKGWITTILHRFIPTQYQNLFCQEVCKRILLEINRNLTTRNCWKELEHIKVTSGSGAVLESGFLVVSCNGWSGSLCNPVLPFSQQKSCADISFIQTTHKP